MTRLCFLVFLFACSSPAESWPLICPKLNVFEALSLPSGTGRRESRLCSSKGGAGGDSSSSRRIEWTSAERERREEAKRRRERSSDVVIGKTSALAGESDYAIDPKATEMEYLRQASAVDQLVYKETEKGMECLKMLRLEEAMQAFDRVFELRPNAYLWQAGIAKFYSGDLEGAAEIFAKNAATFESKFGEPASEERIWRYACGLKMLNSMSKNDRKLVEKTGGVESLLTPIPEKENTQELLRSESRKVIKITRDLFSASVDKDYSGIILSRAKLRSIGGNVVKRPMMDRKLWKINSWYYLGLHYDSIGEVEESKRCMKTALRLCPSTGNGSDIIHTLPLIHMSQRDWFDDDEFENLELGASTMITDETTPTQVPSVVRPMEIDADPIVVESIKSSLAKLRLKDLKEALRARGLKVTGAKEELQQRLFQSLMEDAGLTM